MKAYFAEFQYGATGEGMTFTFGIVVAEDEKQATRKLLQRAFANQNEGLSPDQIERNLEYFGACARAHDVSTNEGLERMKEVLSDNLNKDMVEYVMKFEKIHALHDFFFHCYVNAS